VRYVATLDRTDARTRYPLVVTGGLRGSRLAIALDHDERACSAAHATALLTALVDELGRALGELARAEPRAPRPDDFAHVALDAHELADLLEDLS
jgi:hypothetical protein